MDKMKAMEKATMEERERERKRKEEGLEEKKKIIFKNVTSHIWRVIYDIFFELFLYEMIS